MLLIWGSLAAQSLFVGGTGPPRIKLYAIESENNRKVKQKRVELGPEIVYVEILDPKR